MYKSLVLGDEFLAQGSRVVSKMAASDMACLKENLQELPLKIENSAYFALASVAQIAFYLKRPETAHATSCVKGSDVVYVIRRYMLYTH